MARKARAQGWKPRSYHPRKVRLLSWHDQPARFRAGEDTPRALLERCLETLAALEPTLRCFAATNLEGARKAADAATARYARGRPASPLDGLPVGIKDLFETADMPTQMNSPVYKDWHSGRDAACVWFLRQGGAAIVGKTTTTEFGIDRPDVTRNPFDPECTPGGSSSGSAAAVGARILPAALGTQLMGSIIRPAAYCANYAIKPSFGAINRGGGHSTSPSGSHLGVHAGTLEDMWGIAWWLSNTAGPDPGNACLSGRFALPAALKPRRFIRAYTPGWAETDAASRAAFETLLARLRKLGVETVEPDADPRTAALEQDFQQVAQMILRIGAYEMRWPMQGYAAARGFDQFGKRIQDRIKAGATMTAADYQWALAWRAGFRVRAQALAAHADGWLSPASPGPAPKGIASVGNPIYQTPSSALGAPAVTLPVMAVDGMPFGLQVMGFNGGDERLAAIARWLRDALL